MGAMRGASRKVLTASQLFFDARWRRQFPCPWSAAAGGDPAEDGTPKDKEERQKQFNEKINALERAMGAMEDGDANKFGEAAEALGPASLSQLNMASFCGNNNDRSLLHYAAIRCDLLAARWLLRRGASPNIKSYDTDCYGMNSTSWTPLHHAARNGDVAMCKVLLAAGADVHAELTDPEMKDYDQKFRSLHASGRTLYKQDVLGAGSTPADIATRIGNKPLAELLSSWRPPFLAPERVKMGANVAAAVAEAIAQDPRPVVLRPRHRYCKVPGPLVPEANTR
jgi:ankyrin repeat protein